jgi:hypothetical protein
MNKIRRMWLIATLVLVLAGNGHGADVTLAWDAPITNVDGSALTDLIGYKVEAVSMGVAAVIVSNRVQSLVFSPASTTVVTFLTQTNAPIGLITEINKITGLTSGLYMFRVRAIAASGAESADSNICTNRIGSPATVPLRVVK